MAGELLVCRRRPGQDTLTDWKVKRIEIDTAYISTSYGSLSDDSILFFWYTLSSALTSPPHLAIVKVRLGGWLNTPTGMSWPRGQVVGSNTFLQQSTRLRTTPHAAYVGWMLKHCGIWRNLDNHRV
jgi:hypothetical protein